MSKIFNPAQQITSKLFYNLVAQLEGEQRIGAIKALSILIPITEDGFLSVNGAEPRTDFFVQCFDVLSSAAIALKMLEDDGLIPNIPETPQRKIPQRMLEADLALERLSRLLSVSPKPSQQEH